MALFDVPKLTIQTMSLITYLKDGFPLALVIVYGLPLGFNWVVSFYKFHRHKPDPKLITSRICSLYVVTTDHDRSR